MRMNIVEPNILLSMTITQQNPTLLIIKITLNVLFILMIIEQEYNFFSRPRSKHPNAHVLCFGN